ncbi:MAG: hypothetical protein R3C03_11565 [Pirellulaceae bacterium]
MQVSTKTRWAIGIGICISGCVWFSQKNAQGPVFGTSESSIRLVPETAPPAIGMPELKTANSGIGINHDVLQRELTESQTLVTNPFVESANARLTKIEQDALRQRRESEIVTVTGRSSGGANEGLYATSGAPQFEEISLLPYGPEETTSNSLNGSKRRQSIPGRTAPTPSVVPEQLAQLNSQIDYASSLARKGAFFSARKQYINVLYLVAEQRDTQSGNTFATECLARAWTALDEAEDFLNSDADQNLYTSVAVLIERHQTQVISRTDAEQMSKHAAAQAYFTHAREQFQLGLGQNPVASKALYYLGKMYSLPQLTATDAPINRAAMSIICHYAAMDCDAANYVSANELGVLLARNGHLQEAQAVLSHSIRTKPTDVGYQNLAKVHDELGQSQLATNLREQLRNPGSNVVSQPQPQIQWLSNEQFAQMPNPDQPAFGPNLPNANQPGANQPGAFVADLPASMKPQPEKAKKSLAERLNIFR